MHDEYLHTFIFDVCEILGIDRPKIEEKEGSFFPTKTMLALCECEHGQPPAVYVRKGVQNMPDLLFAVAHELRHVWQLLNCQEIFAEYQESQDLGAVGYNLQTAELDANGFAGAVMVDFFSLKPQFQGLPDEVREKIYRRMEEWKNEGF